MATTEFVIDRSKWRCGGEAPNRRGLGATQLLNKEGFSDAAGFVALQLGCDPKQILGVSGLDETKSVTDIPALKGSPILNDYGYLKPFYRELVIYNDHEGLSDGDREERILSKFVEANLKLSFTGQYVLPLKGGS